MVLVPADEQDAAVDTIVGASVIIHNPTSSEV